MAVLCTDHHILMQAGLVHAAGQGQHLARFALAPDDMGVDGRNRFAAATWISPHACNPEVVVLFKTATAQVEGMSTDLIATQQLRLRRFEPLELRKGLTDRATGQVKGGIIRFPIVQLTVVTLMHRNRFPDGVGALVREYSATQLAPAYQFIDATEKRIPAAYWMDVPASDKPGYIKLMRESRIAMTQQGFYHPKMMALLKKIRCRAEPSSYECSLNEE